MGHQENQSQSDAMTLGKSLFYPSLSFHTSSILSAQTTSALGKTPSLQTCLQEFSLEATEEHNCLVYCENI